MQIDEAVEAHAPELYLPDRVAEGVRGLEAVGEGEVRQYAEEGYILVHDAFTPEEVEAARAGLADLIMGRHAGFEQIQFEAKAAGRLETMSLEERQDAVRKLMAFTRVEPRLRAMAQHARLIRVVERLLGARAELFQDMALLKPPGGREKPWHQDKAYFNVARGTPVVGVWIALDEVTAANGCMHLLAGWHKEPIAHFRRRDWQICDDQMLGRRCVAAPMGPGGCLIFDGLIPHGTPRNNTDQRRRAVQFHYAPVGTVKTSEEERLATFGGEGRGASC